MDAISPKSSNFVCGTGNYSILLCRRFFMRNCIINYEGRYYDTVCSDEVYNSNAEIKEGKGASMTLTDAAGEVIKSETYTRKSDRSEWTTAIGRTTRKAVGLAIAQARNAAGFSVRDLADRCGLDAGHLCRIENGRMNVTLDTVAKICEALGLRLEAVSGSETK